MSRIRCIWIAVSGRFVQIAAGIQAFIIMEPKRRTMEIIRTRLTNKVDHRAGITAELRKKLVGSNTNFLEGVRIVQRNLTAGNARVVDVLLVDHEIVRSEPSAV